MLAISMRSLVILYQSHHYTGHCLFIYHLPLLLCLLCHIFNKSANFASSFRPKIAHCKLKRVENEARVLLKELSVHFFEQKEVFADFLCEISKPIIKDQLIFLLKQQFPNPNLLIILSQFLCTSKKH